jgi:hypothetical protein
MARAISGVSRTRAAYGRICGTRGHLLSGSVFQPACAQSQAISDEDLAHYVRSYASPEQLRVGLEFYRAYPANEQFNAARRDPIDVPIVLAGGEHSLTPLNAKVAESLRNMRPDNTNGGRDRMNKGEEP